MKKFIKWFFIIFISINVVLLLTGKFYYWKALIYNYVNIDDLDIFYSDTVKTGDGAEWKLSSLYNKKELSAELLSELGQFQSVAFLMIHNDSIEYEKYWDGYSDSSLSNSFSMAKSIIGALVGIAIQEGKIGSLDDPVAMYVPKFDKAENRQLTLRHLITMSSGLNWDEQYASLTSQTTEAYYGKRLFHHMMRLKVVTPPGKYFDYMSCNTQILAYVIRNATGKSVSQYASEKIWKPVHAMHDARWSMVRKGGAEKAYCCFYSNARDFARIGKLYLDSGRWEGKQLVPEKYVLESLTPAPIMDGNQPNKNYGYHWWLDTISGKKVFYARGILGQYIIVIPSLNAIIVRLGKERDKNPDGSLRDVPLYVQEAISRWQSG